MFKLLVISTLLIMIQVPAFADQTCHSIGDGISKCKDDNQNIVTASYAQPRPSALDGADNAFSQGFNDGLRLREVRALEKRNRILEKQLEKDSH